jgi:ATP adenylyltransferase
MKPSKLFTLLRDFLTNRMKMSHIYQPVMLMEIMKRGGTASVEEIAKSLLEHDRSQIDYYSEITKKMVGNVLSSKNGIVQKLKT